MEINKQVYCENIEMKSIPEALSRFFDINLILRKGIVNPTHKIEAIKKIVNPKLYIFKRLYLSLSLPNIIIVPVNNKVYSVTLQVIKEVSTLKDLDKVGNATLIIPLSRVDKNIPIPAVKTTK